MEYVFGVLILLSMVWLVYFVMKGGNIMFGIMFVSIFWVGFAFIGYKTGLCSDAFMELERVSVQAKKTMMQVITEIYHQGILNYGANLMTVLFGAWYGAVMIETGVAAALIRRTVELGGDRPVISASLLCIVVAAVFTSVFGIGAVIAIGVIVLPILLSLGISKLSACISYLFSVGAGNFINATLTNGTLGIYKRGGYEFQNYVSDFGFIALVISLIFTIIITILMVGREQKAKVHAWPAADAEKLGDEEKKVPGIALITPILPAVFVVAFKFPILPTFTVLAFLVFAICGRLTSLKAAGTIMAKTYFNAVVDSAALIGFLSFLNVISSALAYSNPFVSILLSPVIPKSTLVLSLVMIVIAPLALFRGPLTLFGAGGTVLLILCAVLGDDKFPFLFPLMWVLSMTLNLMACITQSYVAWAVGYTKLEPNSYLKRSIPYAWVLCAILIAALYIVIGKNF